VVVYVNENERRRNLKKWRWREIAEKIAAAKTDGTRALSRHRAPWRQRGQHLSAQQRRRWPHIMSSGALPALRTVRGVSGRCAVAYGQAVRNLQEGYQWNENEYCNGCGR